jgi:hypothetical protein
MSELGKYDFKKSAEWRIEPVMGLYKVYRVVTAPGKNQAHRPSLLELQTPVIRFLVISFQSSFSSSNRYKYGTVEK